MLTKHWNKNANRRFVACDHRANKINRGDRFKKCQPTIRERTPITTIIVASISHQLKYQSYLPRPTGRRDMRRSTSVAQNPRQRRIHRLIAGFLRRALIDVYGVSVNSASVYIRYMRIGLVREGANRAYSSTRASRP